MLNSGYDWTVPWTKVALSERGALCQMVRDSIHLYDEHLIAAVLGSSGDPLYGAI